MDTYDDAFFDKDVFEGAKEELGRYLEELPSEKDGWGTTDGPAEMQLAEGVCAVCGVISMTGGAVHSYRLIKGSCTPHSGCTRTLPVSPFTTSSTRPAGISLPNTSPTLPTDGRHTSSRQCGKRSFPYKAI